MTYEINSFVCTQRGRRVQRSRDGRRICVPREIGEYRDLDMGVVSVYPERWESTEIQIWASYLCTQRDRRVQRSRDGRHICVPREVGEYRDLEIDVVSVYPERWESTEIQRWASYLCTQRDRRVQRSRDGRRICVPREMGEYRDLDMGVVSGYPARQESTEIQRWASYLCTQRGRRVQRSRD